MRQVRLVRLLALVVGLAVGTTVQAQEPPAPAGGFLEAPNVVPSPVTGETVEPEITIIESEDAVVFEYRIRGVLYMIRVQPQVGPPYFLLDTDGDGVIDAQDPSPKNIAIPQWILFEWN